MTSRPVHLTDGAEALFGMLDQPAEGTWSGVGVLLLAPFGWDAVAAHRSRRAWALSLARAGHLVLRLDLPATGDSDGMPGDPGRLAAWTAAAAAAGAWLRGTGGASRVAAVGAGLGGFVAASACADGGPIDDLALWAVPARGSRIVREIEAFARLQDADLGEARALSPLDEGAIEAGGYVLSAETAAGLRAVDLGTRAWPRSEGRRALLLGRDGAPPDARLHEALAGAGAMVEESSARGYGAMHSIPHESIPAVEVFAAVEAWLARSGRSAGAAAPALRAPAPAAMHGTGRVPVRELAVEAATQSAELLGVLTEPGDGSDRGAVAAVLLNAGAIPRSGPSRMWVEAARRWAAAGVPTLRLDVEGIGDAGGPDARDADVALYDPRFVEQVRAGLDALEERAGPRRYLLAGLCSGSYWALHTALADPRVATAVMLNPRLLVWDPRVPEIREARRVLGQARGPGWRRALHEGWSPARVRRLAVKGAGALGARLRTARVSLVDVSPTVDAVLAAPQRFVLAFSGDEPLRDELAAAGLLDRLAAGAHVDVVALPGSDHTLRPIAAQRAAHAVLDSALRATCEDLGTA